MEISKSFLFEAAHRLPNHQGKCRNIHGHNYKIVISIQGDLNDNDMVIDFGDLSPLKDIVDRDFDHAIILSNSDPLVKHEAFSKVLSEFNLKHIVISGEPTAENLAKYFFRQFYSFIAGKNLNLSKVVIYENLTSKASYTFKDYELDRM